MDQQKFLIGLLPVPRYGPPNIGEASSFVTPPIRKFYITNNLLHYHHFLSDTFQSLPHHNFRTSSSVQTENSRRKTSQTLKRSQSDQTPFPNPQSKHTLYFRAPNLHYTVSPPLELHLQPQPSFKPERILATVSLLGSSTHVKYHSLQPLSPHPPF